MEEISPTFIWTHFFFLRSIAFRSRCLSYDLCRSLFFCPTLYKTPIKKCRYIRCSEFSWKEVYSIAKHWTKHPWEMQLHRVLRIIMHSHDSLKLILLLNIVQNTYKKWNCIRCSEFPCNLTMISSLFVCCTLYKIPRIQHNDCQYQQDLFIV